ncbi:interferon lambda-4-like [Elephas maximus indicus]|uniref:interferon lambda-4-like n=1 Tax=Elephas maximus indicus TaxID=99487 RepID=UPI002116014E|nr:interferon lambda-4-like [Elephas maximus indicus]
MGLNVGAAVAVGLWVLVTVGVAADPVVQVPRPCLLSHYRSLDPKVLAAVKALRDRYEEEALTWRPRTCSFRLRRVPPKPASCARLRVVARGLADAQAVLSSLRSLELLPGTRRTLELLAAAGRDVGACLEPVRPGWSRKSLRPPRERHKARRAEKRLRLKKWRCSSYIFPSTWDLRDLQVWERPVALKAELAMTLKVLGTVANSALGAILDQPLHTLHHIHSKLWACVPVNPTAGPRPWGRLHRRLHRLQEATKKESRRCLQASVMFNIFRLLTRDLKCVASGDQCA